MFPTAEDVGQLYLLYARSHDVVLFKYLVVKAYPEMLWGDYYRQLSEEDRAWVDSLDLN